MSRPARRRLLDDRGNASVSVVFLIAAAIIGGILTGITVNLVNVASASRGHSAVNAAADQRFTDYLAGLDGAGNGNEDEICYPGTASCASILSVTDTPTERTVVIDAVYGQTQRVEVTRILKRVGGTHISGYDESGQPVWVTEPGTAEGFAGFSR